MRTSDADRDAAPGSLEALRETNRARVVGVLREIGSASRAQIARRTGLSRSTVSTVVSDLIASGVAREGDETVPAAGGAGRPAVPITLNASAGAVLGIDLAHDGVRVMVSDLAHTLLEERWTPAGIEAMEGDAVLAVAADAAIRALDAAGVPRGRLVGAAVAVPSPIDPRTGILGAESGIPGLAGVDVGGHLSTLIGTAVRAENDANLCALAEVLWGVARGYDNVVYAKLSRGIGAGLVLNGQLYRGRHGSAGELGHTPVVPEGPVCRCGNRGCLEVVAGSGALLELVAPHFSESHTIAGVAAAADEDDPICRRAFRDIGTLVGTALAATTNLLNPDLIVIGGELVAGWAHMEVPVHEALDRAAIHRSATDVVITPSTLGRRAEALGAVAMVLRGTPELLAAAS